MTLTEYINHRQLDYYFLESKRTILGSIILSSAVLYMFHILEIPLIYTLNWYFLLTFLSVLRFILARNYANEPDLTPLILAKYSQKNLIILGLSSLLWAFAYWLMMHYGDNSYDLVAILILIGFIGSSILSAGNKFSFYLALNLIPTIFAFSLFLLQDSQNVTLAPALSLLAISYIYFSAYHYAAKTVEKLTEHYQLVEAKKDIIRTLGRAGEYRDEDTGDHILRMSHSCYLLAKKFGIDEECSRQIENASTLHDLGKIGIPDQILLKPDRLTEEEMEVMKSHTIIGCQILENVDGKTIELAKTISLTHHEKWDGSGYPNGLKGTEIPLEGRIVAICDVFDALISERPYKEAWSVERARDYIVNHSGSHFDPTLVPVFIKIFPDIVTYRNYRP